ncbi:MAG: 6-bladed beta-propeller [Tannerella sp.]|jgi:hypothetical protein|nr:6-bladed beta-propeller [Tannerella sp.]
MKRYYKLLTISLLFVSCTGGKHGELPEFPVDRNQDYSLPLSEIIEDITVIEPELTDESLIGYGYGGTGICRMIRTENNIIVVMGGLGSPNTVLLFKQDGKFIQSVGSKGQGPGEYNFITNATCDEANRHLFILTDRPFKIICYDLDGKFVKESLLNTNGVYYDINYNNIELYLECLSMDGKISKRILYRLNNNLQVMDSIVCWENYYEQFIDMHRFPDYIVKNGTSMYFLPKEYYPKFFAPSVKVLRDTLYRIENHRLVPDFKLKFKDDGMDLYGDKVIGLLNLYRSSRYIFANYEYNPDNREINKEQTAKYSFCYDTKTGKSYNMLDGYTDDIHGIEKRIEIRPLTSDSEYFYYWYTHMNPDDPEEPNPTLYIGKLKK